MKIRITNLVAELNDERKLEELVAARLKVLPKKILGVKLVRKAIDARRYRGAGIKFNYIVDAEISPKTKFANSNGVKKIIDGERIFSARISKDFRHPVVVGFGPAGMFAALTLAKAGFAPIIFERGADVDSRTSAIEKFFKTGVLDVRSNVQFGEGGAGTFSDGKLTTRLNDPLIDEVLKIFVEAGAPQEILFLQKPHIGTDKLREVVKNIRKKILSLGGKIFFNAQMTDFEFGANGKISGVIVNDEEKFLTDAVFFGVGHSARDTYEMLISRGVAMEQKNFAIGVRIEHPQEFIDFAQFGEDFKNPKLPAADYLLTFKDEQTGRGAYNFCMCPGGQVVAAASEVGRVVTNGMSNFLRDSGVANSALLVTVGAEDFKNFGADVLAGMRFQRHYEELAFKFGGENYFAPVQAVGDFLNGRVGTKNFLVKPSYPVGITYADLHECLPSEVSKTLENALRFFDNKIKNFSVYDVPLTGVETRTSSPCRILRDKKTYESISTPGLFPIGEGAGYAGGIMSSAIDGMKAVLS